MTTALLLIDIQNDYFPGGKMALVGSPQAARQARRLLDHFRQAGLPVIHVQHIAADPGATFFLPGTEGAMTHADVQPLPGETVIVKHFPNSFRETPLLDRLQGLKVDRLAIAGMMTHMCVDATTRAADDFDFECLIAGEACATRDLKFGGQVIPAAQVQGAFLAALNGTYGKVLGVEEITASVPPPRPAPQGTGD